MSAFFEVPPNVVEHIKAKNGYTEKQKNCGNCTYLLADPDRQNYTPVDVCTRNPDVRFTVSRTACCLKWKSHKDDNS